eukprot:229781-Pyramimonas_sp.AAC.1
MALTIHDLLAKMRAEYLRKQDVDEWVDRSHLWHSEQAPGHFFPYFQFAQANKPFIVFGDNLHVVAPM